MNRTTVLWLARGICVLAGAASVLGLAGCASVSVQHERVAQTRNEPGSPPKVIYVADFDTTDAAFRVNGSEAQARVTAARKLSDALVERLNKFVAPAVRAPGKNFNGKDGWLLTGRFEKVNGGNAGLRIVLGLGAGGSKMNTTVYLRDLRRHGDRAFLTFQTTGGSGASPGLVTIPLAGPVSLPLLVYDVGTKVYGEENHGVKDDSARTARMIAAAVSEYMARRGFPMRGKELKAKRDWTAAVLSPL